MKKSILYVCAFVFVGIYSCKKESDQIDNAVKAPLEIEFDHIVGGKKLAFEATNYNSAGQEFTIDLLKYYISNIKLKTTEGKEVVVPQDESYFLIDASNAASCRAHINIPEGDYAQLSFVLGVDSLRNTKPIEDRTGVLDPENEMYWGWNSGYIFFKMEGSSPSIPAVDKKYRFHIGGFGGYSTPTVNNLRTIQLDLTKGGIAKVRADRKANVHLKIDLLKVVDGNAHTFDFSADAVNIMSPAAGTAIADNCAGMFVHDHSH